MFSKKSFSRVEAKVISCKEELIPDEFRNCMGWLFAPKSYKKAVQEREIAYEDSHYIHKLIVDVKGRKAVIFSAYEYMPGCTIAVTEIKKGMITYYCE